MPDLPYAAEMPVRRHEILIPLMVVGVIVLLPVIIPAALILDALNNLRKRQVAASFKCLTCGQVLDIPSLHLADHEWSKKLKDLHQAYPFTRFRMLRTCHAICAACGTPYTFRQKERTFVLEASQPSSMPA